MRILHIVHQYPPDQLGGTELYTQDLARRQAAAGHEPAVFVPAVGAFARADATLEQGVRVYRPPVGSSSRRKVFVSTFTNRPAREAFEQVLDREQPAVVHIQHLMGLPASLVRVLQERQIPCAVTLHDYWYLCANAQLLTNYDHTLCAGPDRYLNCAGCFLVRGGLPDNPVMRRAAAPLLARRNRILAPALEQAQTIIAPSQFIRDEYARLGADTQRVVIVPHGIALPAEMPSRRPSATDKLQVVYLGGIAWQKGVHVLVEAANALPDGIEVTIYGDLSVSDDYSARLQQQAQNPAITFGGRVEREQVWTALAAADVVVVPSIWYENAPLVIQEAKAAGAPVIASRLGALPEHVRDGEDGLLFPADDAAALRQLLLLLRGQPEQLERLRAGIGAVRSIEEHVRDVAGVYRSIAR